MTDTLNLGPAIGWRFVSDTGQLLKAEDIKTGPCKIEKVDSYEGIYRARATDKSGFSCYLVDAAQVNSGSPLLQQDRSHQFQNALRMLLTLVIFAIAALIHAPTLQVFSLSCLTWYGLYRVAMCSESTIRYMTLGVGAAAYIFACVLGAFLGLDPSIRTTPLSLTGLWWPYACPLCSYLIGGLIIILLRMKIKPPGYRRIGACHAFWIFALISSFLWTIFLSFYPDAYTGRSPIALLHFLNERSPKLGFISASQFSILMFIVNLTLFYLAFRILEWQEPICELRTWTASSEEKNCLIVALDHGHLNASYALRFKDSESSSVFSSIDDNVFWVRKKASDSGEGRSSDSTIEIKGPNRSSSENQNGSGRRHCIRTRCEGIAKLGAAVELETALKGRYSLLYDMPEIPGNNESRPLSKMMLFSHDNDSQGFGLLKIHLQTAIQSWIHGVDQEELQSSGSLEIRLTHPVVNTIEAEALSKHAETLISQDALKQINATVKFVEEPVSALVGMNRAANENLKSYSKVLIDIGDGTTDLCFKPGGEKTQLHTLSFPIGARRCASAFRRIKKTAGATVEGAHWKAEEGWVGLVSRDNGTDSNGKTPDKNFLGSEAWRELYGSDSTYVSDLMGFSDLIKLASYIIDECAAKVLIVSGQGASSNALIGALLQEISRIRQATKPIVIFAKHLPKQFGGTFGAKGITAFGALFATGEEVCQNPVSVDLTSLKTEVVPFEGNSKGVGKLLLQSMGFNDHWEACGEGCSFPALVRRVTSDQPNSNFGLQRLSPRSYNPDRYIYECNELFHFEGLSV